MLGTCLVDSTQEEGGNGKLLKLAGERSVCEGDFKPASGRKSKGSQVSWMSQACGAKGKERLQHLQVHA